MTEMAEVLELACRAALLALGKQWEFCLPKISRS